MSAPHVGARGEQDGSPEGAAPELAPAISLEAFLSTYLPALVLALGVGIAIPAVPTLAKSFGVDFGVASGVATAFLLGNLSGAIPSGWLIDRFGRRFVMVAGPLLTSAMAFLAAFAHSFPELLVLRFLDGCAAQMWLMGRLAAISHSGSPRQRGRQIAWMFSMDNLGKLVGPVIGGFIASAWGPRAPFLAYAAIALLALGSTSVFRPDGPSVRGAASRAAGRKLTLRQLVMPRLIYFGVGLFAGLTRGPVQADLLHLYAAFAYHLGPKQIGYLATGAACLSWPIGVASGWLLDRFGRIRTMAPGFIGMSLAMVGLSLTALLHLSLSWYVALFFFGIALLALTAGSIQTVGADVAPPEARGAFLGLWRFTGQGGAALSPIVFALLSTYVSYAASFLFIAAAAATVTLLLIRYVPEPTGHASRDAGRV